MKVKQISISKIIILCGVVTTTIYALYLGMENIAATGLGILGGYLMKDIDTVIKSKPKKDENIENKD